MIDARALAKATGAAKRAADPVNALARLCDDLGLTIARQANAVVEELDLLRHHLHEALLAGVVATGAPLAPIEMPPGVAAALEEAKRLDRLEGRAASWPSRLADLEARVAALEGHAPGGGHGG